MENRRFESESGSLVGESGVVRSPPVPSVSRRVDEGRPRFPGSFEGIGQRFRPFARDRPPGRG